MRTTLAIDDALLERAMALSGFTERTALVREGLKALIERDAARRLARLDGSEPGVAPAPRRRTRASSDFRIGCALMVPGAERPRLTPLSRNW